MSPATSRSSCPRLVKPRTGVFPITGLASRVVCWAAGRSAWGTAALSLVTFGPEIRGKDKVPAVRFDVTDADTAAALGSGDVPVLATPRLIAWMEAATVQAATRFVDAGQTTVGTSVRIEHRRPTPVGGSVETSAEASSPIGGRLTFTVKAVDSFGEVVAVGEIDRAIVDRERFLEAASKPGSP